MKKLTKQDAAFVVAQIFNVAGGYFDNNTGFFHLTTVRHARGPETKVIQFQRHVDGTPLVHAVVAEAPTWEEAIDQVRQRFTVSNNRPV